MPENNHTRVRFAPSPTGYLHIGGLRMVVFNYLIAKKYGGKMVLRIEDTDQKREVQGAASQLIDILKWTGIEFDEDPIKGGEYGPYTQSARTDLYRYYAEQLVENGHAYRCFCSEERLEQMREKQKQEKKAPKYDGHCRHLTKEQADKYVEEGHSFVIRQKLPQEGSTKVKDELRGEIEFQNEDLEDHVLLKSDGIPTYQLASVVDDGSMDISHVVRGEEWISSFPKNVLLYQALGWEIPYFIHLPLTLNKDGSKLSKRQGDVAVEEYRDKGFLPEALLNFCALLGWHPRDEREIFYLDEVVSEFEIGDIKTSASTFDVDKLLYLNGYYIRQKGIEELTDLCLPYLRSYIDKTSSEYKKGTEFIKRVVAIEQERLKKLSDIEELVDLFFVDLPEYDGDLLLWKKMDHTQTKQNLETIHGLLKNIEEKDWTQDHIEETVVNYIKENEEKVGNFLWPMRAALTGKQQSPGPFEVAATFTKEEALKRIEHAISKL